MSLLFQRMVFIMSTKKNSRTAVRAICEGALFVAAAQVLGYLKLLPLPSGGSVSLGMLPIFIFCSRWGFRRGLMASSVFALLQLVLDGAYAWGWQSIIGDYLLAYALLGVAGLFSRRKGGFFTGCLVGGLARFLCTWVTGATVWAEYMPDSFFGMTMTSPWFYSALYNGSYISLSIILCIAVGALLWKPLGKYIRGEDIKL